MSTYLKLLDCLLGTTERHADCLRTPPPTAAAVPPNGLSARVLLKLQRIVKECLTQSLMKCLKIELLAVPPHRPSAINKCREPAPAAARRRQN